VHSRGATVLITNGYNRDRSATKPHGIYVRLA
jgi:uncharacterized protein YwbE